MYSNRYGQTRHQDSVKVAVYTAQQTVSNQQRWLPIAFTVAVLAAWLAYGLS